jgi:hypothetical protein
MYFEPHQYDRPIDGFTQSELNYLIRELQLNKETVNYSVQGCAKRACWHPGLNFLGTGIARKNFENIMHRKINLYFVRIFVIFCISCERENMILAPSAYLSTSKRSLKDVLLHKSNVLASIPFANSTKLSESYETLKLVLEKIKYHEHEWLICGDLKVIGLLLGLQRGYTKCPCFLCQWDSRARDKLWETVHWPEKEPLQPGSQNVSTVSLVERERFSFHTYTSNWE